MTKLYYDISFWAIGINITWQWRHNSFSFKQNFSPHRPELWKYFKLHVLWMLFFRYAKFYRNLWEEFRDILKFLQKGYKLCMNWRLDLCRQICYLMDVSGTIRKGFTTHSFCKFNPYTINNQLNASRLGRSWKTWKHVNLGIKRNAELFL